MAGLKAELQALAQKFMDCFAKGDVEAAAMYTDNCTIIAPGEDIVSGRKDALVMLKKWIASGKKIASVNIIECDGSDSSAWSRQEFTFEGEAGVLRNVMTYKKVGGQWLAHVDIWNSK